MQTDLKLDTLNIALTDWQPSFNEFLLHDYRRITRHQLRAKSMRLANQHLNVFSKWHEATFKQTFDPSALTNYDLHLYRKWSLENEKVKAATWNSRHWALGILCLWIEKQYGYTNLMDGIEQKKQVNASTRHRSLTDDEYHRLVHTLEQDPRRAVTTFEYQNAVRNWAALSLMLHAGLRVEEVSLLEASDITINERSGDMLIRHGKGDKERTVPLNLIARNALASWLDLQAASASSTLFGVSVRTLQRAVEEIGQRIGVPDLTCHWLRYTFAKRLEKLGIAISAICKLLGHNSSDTTLRYLRSSMEDLQSAVEGAM